MTDSDRVDGTSSRDLVIICTRNRPDDLGIALEKIREASPTIPVLVADSSTDPSKERVRTLVAPMADVELLDCTPGLARQRNQALEWVSSHRPHVELVHFLDDDSEVSPRYFEHVDAMFDSDGDIGGVGGVITNQELPRNIRAKELFLLYSRTPGRVLTSGRVSLGHYPGHEAEAPQLLPGCCMSYRRSAIEGLRFDDRLEGYSLGEDLYFSFAVSQRHRLAVAKGATIVHRVSEVNRTPRVDLANERLQLKYRWVRENRRAGLRPAHFWYSVLGEIVLHLVNGVVRREQESFAWAWATFRGAVGTAVRPLPARDPGAPA